MSKCETSKNNNFSVIKNTFLQNKLQSQRKYYNNRLYLQQIIINIPKNLCKINKHCVATRYYYHLVNQDLPVYEQDGALQAYSALSLSPTTVLL